MQTRSPYPPPVGRRELEGYLELGMTREGLALVRRLLTGRPIAVGTFTDCVMAVLSHADQLRPWRRLVEDAFQALPARARSQAGPCMLYFLAELEDWAHARAFIPARTAAPAELLFAMRTLLALRDLPAAKRIFRRCRRRWDRLATGGSGPPPGAFEAGTLVEAMAAYLAQAGRWGQAERLWDAGKRLGPFADAARDSLLKLHALRAELIVRETAEHGRAEDAPFVLQSCAERRRDDRQRRARRAESARQLRHLARICPESERWRFGVPRTHRIW